MADGVTGTISNCTFAGNRAPGEVAFTAATVGGQGVVLKNTIFADHEVGNGYNPIPARRAARRTVHQRRGGGAMSAAHLDRFAQFK